ncbi:methenyltetrahydromethanopterin cyclohydrolase [Tuwongella immobilis]|uniref:Methenyltetrahydromethanopterin cyclohydrolase n=1 Tax=Tuwongella immobilis TaxID=692036 RepID=A0A6C2YPI6_9BACT|nr:methenyltetrahydromethanopterin cyclohydrolase [Tuwongella immobilis]VIP03376.1 n -methenyltetrahydromethanopterin cyclohydrolase : Methenyltetrahydromethanopterin cyclohydrolase OS=Singulisphaera acidiphila (strain ATCC BAA-1392 / DSM 18658 / VKM B-2454 / MOB10) GN=Sinac_1236 PE=4 SV=1: MCH [Tuwongella immobilis]VTS04124.1 n -methenyltetrahydromethanopterin cyclohydrolase : Methenyltetrahydromethanopterin cyclohydrolase OS=Singulisphaera acidiphila (strain ATCC BAA-1392 / DSM 18658 / VKM B-24
MSSLATLNEQAAICADEMEFRSAALRIGVSEVGGARLLDCGATMPGGLQAGVLLARLCLSDRAEVSMQPGGLDGIPGPLVQVVSDDPIRACLASQYAGWQVQVGKYFAMGSGPMRAAANIEKLFSEIPGHETPPVAVGALETRKVPTEEVISYLVEKLPKSVRALTLAFAPASSIAGSVQVVARSLETALHKLHTLHFPLSEIISGYGVAPLPPIANEELKAIGWTNDAILYAGRVVLWVRADDDQLAELGPKVPSSGSSDYGAPFQEIFKRAGDFYKIDPMLFSPAEIVFHNLTSGRTHRFGQLAPDIYRKSIGE